MNTSVQPAYIWFFFPSKKAIYLSLKIHHPLHIFLFALIAHSFWTGIVNGVFFTTAKLLSLVIDFDLSIIHSEDIGDISGTLANLVLYTPFIETVIFNAIIQFSFLKLLSSYYKCIAITSIVFALAHIGIDALFLFNALCTGFYLCIIYLYFYKKYNYFWAFVAAFVFHSVVNFSASGAIMELTNSTKIL